MFSAVDSTGCRRGRVCSASRGAHFLVSIDGEEFAATVSGKLRHDPGALWPATGDWVRLRDGSLIEGVEPRSTTISRKEPGRVIEEQVLAANVDQLWIVTGLDHDYNPRRLERYLLLAAESGAEPVVVLNKADLHHDVSPFLESTRSLASRAQVLSISATLGWGIGEIRDRLQGSGLTVAVIGSSGAGKSTLVNALLGEGKQRTSEVRPGDQRGRHTTTHRELIRMPGGWSLIDMPGLRELQLWADPETLGEAFADIEDLAARCRFRDCRHQGEPGCAVAAEGLDQGRLANFTKLQRELAYVERQRDVQAQQQEKKRWKAIHKAMRHVDKRKG